MYYLAPELAAIQFALWGLSIVNLFVIGGLVVSQAHQYRKLHKFDRLYHQNLLTPSIQTIPTGPPPPPIQRKRDFSGEREKLEFLLDLKEAILPRASEEGRKQLTLEIEEIRARLSRDDS